ncbi:23S rRNA pseudouridine(1911/1915/1917) synthase RluD [Candidatus Thiosymbion oneisti]|uniref:23S rRNA pseudouridine(1911/1915/1917) synthase RluD n=1 Tax=Candidatus Thiosymbion oneisti TaxID=589554 RepID=UPI000A6C8F5B|nr:23S rRNA pseudouridine(1911/1915/1917) synthase RluD [Candidatus Thiosymbion oneisti]
MKDADRMVPAEHCLRIDPALTGRRLDQVLAELLPEYSRSRLQRLLDQGLVLVDGRTRRRRDKVRGGEEIRLKLVPEPCNLCVAQPIALDILFEDDQLLVVNKPAGLVVHPAAGNRDGTLQNALLHHLPQLDSVPRAGIVHRLDKDTSGLLVVAKTLLAHKSLVDQLQRRSLYREYRALVQGILVAGGTIDAPIGRDPLRRTKMAVVSGGRPAVTHYRVRERFDAHTLLAVRLQTGRTHQIRVHMVHIRHPLVGDRTYGGRPRPPQGAGVRLTEALQGFPRQALHATALGCDHPLTGTAMHWEIPLPGDMHELLSLLQEHDGPKRLSKKGP